MAFTFLIVTHLYLFVFLVRTRGSDSTGLVAMATEQPGFIMAAAGSTAAAAGGGNQQGQQGVSPAVTIAVVTSPPQQVR